MGSHTFPKEDQIVYHAKKGSPAYEYVTQLKKDTKAKFTIKAE